MLFLQEVTIQQARYNVRTPIIAVITKRCGGTEKEALGSASERREKLTVVVKFEFSDGLMLFKVEEITSPKEHRIKSHETTGKWQSYTVSFGGVDGVAG